MAGAGKGDDYRPVNQKKWDENWEHIFGTKDMPNAKFIRPQGHACKISTGIHEGLTIGTGELDFNGCWEHPCQECARAWEKQFPQDAPVWPYPKK